MPWVECWMCNGRAHVDLGGAMPRCGCNNELMHLAPWDQYSDEKRWTMYAAHAPVGFILGPNQKAEIDTVADMAAEYADELLKCHKQRWEKNL